MSFVAIPTVWLEAEPARHVCLESEGLFLSVILASYLFFIRSSLVKSYIMKGNTACENKLIISCGVNKVRNNMI